jgi:hypothetical protein
LKFHPTFVPGALSAVTVRVNRVTGNRVMLRFRFDGSANVRVPPQAEPMRADELWRTTCCELFLADGEGHYREFNFSPSGQWAAYRFSAYRTRSGDYEPLTPPEITMDRGISVLTLTAFLDAGDFAGALHASVTAVAEEEKGRMSYWAPRHAGLKPDFHNPACFVLPVP